MQAQRSALQAIPEIFDLENMSDQPNVDLESHIYQSERPNLMDAPSLPDYQVVGERLNHMDAPSLPDFQAVNERVNFMDAPSLHDFQAVGSSPSRSFRNIGSQSSGSSSFVNGWATASVTNSDISASEDKMVIGRNPVSNMQSTSRFERQVVDSHVLHSDGNSYNFSANRTAVANEGQLFMDWLDQYLAGSESEQVTFARCTSENSNGRTNHPMDGRPRSRKRKAVESISGPSFSQLDDGHLRLTAPGRQTIGSRLNIPATTATIPAVSPVEEALILWASSGDVDPDFRGLSMVGQSEAVRARHNPPHQQEQSLPQIWPSGNDQSADTGPSGVRTSAQLPQPSMFHVQSGTHRSLHSVGCNESSSRPRLGNASSSNAGARRRSSSQQEEASSRNMMMGMARNTRFVAGLENRATNHESGNWVPMNRNPNGPGNNASARQRSSSRQKKASSRNMTMSIASDIRFVAGSENRATNHESGNWVPMNRNPNGPENIASKRQRSSSQQNKASSRNMTMGIASNTWFVGDSENRATNHESGNWVPMNRNPSELGDIASARERSSSQQEEASSINMMMGNASNTNTWFVAGMENRATNHESGNWFPINQNPNGPGDVASSMLHPLPGMPWGSHHIPFTQAPRTSRGSSQRQGLSSSVSRPLQGSHFNPSRNKHSSSSSDVSVPPVTGLQAPQYLTSAAVLMERQGDGFVGVPFGSLQAIAAEGGNLGFEDIFISDPSAFYAAANAHDQHRDMRLDVDNMTYEELLDLEERIGNVSTGLSEETVSKCLKRSAYYSGIEFSADDASKKQPEDELCSICLEEYKDNEELGILDCGHIHHSDCIRKWLLLKNICPVCKKTALNVRSMEGSERPN